MANKRFVSFLLACIMLVTIFFSPITVHATESKGLGCITLTNTKGVCAVRKDPSFNSPTLFSLTNGTSVSVLETVTNSEGSWYRVRYTKDFKDGYVETSKVTFKNSGHQNTESQVSAEKKGSQASFGYIRTSKSSHPIRAEANSMSTVVTSLTDRTNVYILYQVACSDGIWYWVKYTEKHQGYVHEDYVVVTKWKSSTTDDQVQNKEEASTSGTIPSFGYIKTQNATHPMRTEANGKSAVVTYLTGKTNVSILYQVTCSDGIWYWVKYTGQYQGFVHEDYVHVTKWKSDTGNQDSSSNGSISTEKYAVPKDGIVQVGTRLKGRTVPSDTEYEVIEYLYDKDFVQILERTTDNLWVKVITPSGKEVWCYALYIKEGTWVKISDGQTNNEYTKENSKYNAALACSRLTGTVIFPGETFSWLRTMGACSKAKGFKESTVLVSGKSSIGYGGGVCQVSTTINIAVKNADIRTEATKHSVPSSYAKREDEATVSYGSGIDFSFTNTLDETIKLVLSYKDGVCVCTVYRFVVS